MSNFIGVATSSRGPLCKKFPGGKSGVFSRGYIETHACDSFGQLRTILSSLGPKQCIVMGVPTNSSKGDISYIGPSKDLRAGEIARTKNNFIQGSFILVDYDYSKPFPCNAASDVHSYMCELLPDVFTGAGYLAVKSSSSRVLCNEEPLKGTSWHLYYMVDAPKQVKWLADNLMLSAQEKNLTFIKVSTDGKQLPRTVIDLQPLKIGGCGIVYEADPIVSHSYSLIKSKIRIIKGKVAKVSVLKPASKGVGIKRGNIKLRKAEGYWKKSRSLHYSAAYRALTPAQRDVLNDLCMEYRGSNHGTENNPIKCPYEDFIVHPTTVKKALDALQEIGFIRYVSNVKVRKPNHYFLNFDMLFMKRPKGWESWS